MFLSLTEKGKENFYLLAVKLAEVGSRAMGVLLWFCLSVFPRGKVACSDLLCPVVTEMGILLMAAK
jgi:hypothetical protein